MPDEHLAQRAFADAIVDRAASQLRQLLEQLTAPIDPLPPFPGSMFTYGIEVPPPTDSSLGCVIVGEEGQLYEFQLGLDDEAVASGGDAFAARIEHLEALDLEPTRYISHAYAAIGAVLAHLDEAERGVT